MQPKQKKIRVVINHQLKQKTYVNMSCMTRNLTERKRRTKVFVGGNLVSNPNQVLSSLELATQDAGLILKVLLNPTLGRDASHPCLISTWPKEEYTIVCVILHSLNRCQSLKKCVN